MPLPKGRGIATLGNLNKKRNDYLNFLKYFVLIQDDKVLGLTGLYQEKEDDEHECWLGWFCIDESARGLGIGRKLLEFSIETTQYLDFKKLHLYTYDSDFYKSDEAFFADLIDAILTP